MEEASYRAKWARLLVRDQLVRELSAHKPGTLPFPNVPWSRNNLPHDDKFELDHPGKAKGSEGIKLCIVGAGMAGLYIAFILDALNIPNVSYEILEASDRVGGRCFTYDFSSEKHDYYDVGAMRFPENKVMDRTFKLFKDTGTPTIPYYFSDGTVNCPMLFNDVQKIKPIDWKSDPFNISASTGLPTLDPDAILGGVMAPYINALEENQEKGFKLLMTVDEYSTREYLRQKTPYNKPDVIEYLETFSGSSDAFDGAFSEAVIEALDFGTSKWRCIEGGVKVIVKNTLDKLKTKPQLGKQVTGIYINSRSQESQESPSILSPYPMRVRVAGEERPREYSTVFCTTTLACAERMDLHYAELNWGQKTAIRALAYGPATKVAIKFSRPWWITDCHVTSAGIGSTDEPIRTCVYPSYNIYDPPDKPAVLLCSYTWTQDALRLGSLVKRDSPIGEEELLEVMLRGLARLHQNDITYEEIKSLYITHHGFSWYQDQYTSGAYASFGPSQFSTLYPYLTRPAGRGFLIFAGEAMSAHHAWIVGALESGWRAVYQFLYRFGMFEEIKTLVALFGTVPEVEQQADGTAHLQVILGSLPANEQVNV